MHTILTKTLYKDAASCTYKSPNDIFTAVIMYQKKCIESYLSQFKRDVHILLDTDKDKDNDLSSDNNGLPKILSIILYPHWNWKCVVTH